MAETLSQGASQTVIDFPPMTPLTQWHRELFSTADTFWKWMESSIDSLQRSIVKAWTQTRYILLQIGTIYSINDY